VRSQPILYLYIELIQCYRILAEKHCIAWGEDEAAAGGVKPALASAGEDFPAERGCAGAGLGV
jgi:hypothetical protein